MKPGQKNNTNLDHERLRTAETGNASNPSANEEKDSSDTNQLLDEKAGTYLREAGNIEDMPDENDQKDMDETFREA